MLQSVSYNTVVRSGCAELGLGFVWSQSTTELVELFAADGFQCAILAAAYQLFFITNATILISTSSTILPTCVS